MTNEEAIKSLKKLKSFHNGSYGTAINLAIKALEQEASETFQNTYDLGYEEGVDVGYTRGYTEAMSDLYERGENE